MTDSQQKKRGQPSSRKTAARNSDDAYIGMLLIGDPHIEGRQPGFRKDDFPNVILGKVEWCLNYAKANQLLPVFLGDMFDKPRDNPTWMIGNLIDIMSRVPSIGIYGNHDCAEATLNENDSLTILIKAGCMRIVSERFPWSGMMNGRQVFVGGSSYRQPIPFEFKLTATRRRSMFDDDPFVVWLTHHDIVIAGYENGRVQPHEIENVDLLVNGHIHKRLETVTAGRTKWMTPGNISRRSRSEAAREHVPMCVRIDVHSEDYSLTDVVVPHEKHDVVFHSAVAQTENEQSSSEFVTGLAELNSRRTESGAGLHAFLAENLCQFEPAVAMEIKALANEVTGTGELQDV